MTLPGLGDTFATSLYTVAEYEATRESYRRTVAYAKTCNISYVTPWIALGGGERRVVDLNHDATTAFDTLWDYDVAYSWMIGKEIADPFYSKHPARFAPWGAARAVALYPNPLDATAWAEPPTLNKTTGGVSGGNVLSSIGLKHFVACKESTVACDLSTCFDRVLVFPDVKGAAGIRINTTKRLHPVVKTDDVSAAALTPPKFHFYPSASSSQDISGPIGIKINNVSRRVCQACYSTG